MKKYFKKVTAAVLAGIMMLSSAFVINASEADEPTLLPLRMVFEANGADVSWNSEGRFITVYHNGDNFAFHPGSQTAYRNNEQFQLTRPIEIDAGGRARVVYDDIAFLFESGQGVLSGAKRAAIETSYMLLEALDIAGITIALVDRDSGYTWTQGIGFADIANGIYVDETTLFDIGSVSKTFAAVAVMQLVEQGIIDLDEPIVTYLPNFSVQPHPVHGGDYRNITARMLLSHFSGLPVDFFSGMGTTGRHYRGFMNNILSRLAAAHMDNAELQRFSYANNGFVLAGVLVAHMAGHEDFFQGYLDLTQENIFTPAGMHYTTFEINQNTNNALPYTTASLPPEEIVFANVPPAGGLFSNARDMARFMHIILNGGSFDGSQILSEASVSEMFRVQDFDFTLSPMVQTGLGTLRMTNPVDGFVSVGHDGNWLTFHTSMQFDLETGIGVFVSTNSTSGTVATFTLSHAILTEAIFERTGNRSTLTPLPPGEPTELSREELERFVGYYASLGHVRLNDNDVLVAEVPGLPFAMEFTPYTDGSFGALGFRFWFEEVDGRMVFFQGDHRFILNERIYNTWKADENFNRWMGVYNYNSEIPGGFSIFNSVTLSVNDEGYAFVQMDAGELALTLLIGSIDENTFYVLGTGRNLGTVIRLYEDSEGTWLDMAGARFVR